MNDLEPKPSISRSQWKLIFLILAVSAGAQAITQTKRDTQSRVVSLLLDKNEEKPSTEAYRTVTDLQNSGGDLQVVDKVGVPDGI